jgi:hypothetical protein
MRSVLTRTSKTTGDVRLDDTKFGIPRQPPRAGPPRNRIYKPRRGLNDISVLSKYRYGRSFSLGKAVLWRMSA